MIVRLEDVATYDDDGRVEGMQFDSRQRRIQQWREKKEDREFDLLVAKLRQKKNYQAWYARRKEEPGFREKMRAHNKRMKDRHRDRRNAEYRVLYQKEIARKTPQENTCQECGKVFLQEAGFKKKKSAKFCSRACRNRESYKRRDRDTTERKEAVFKVVQSQGLVSSKEATAFVELSQASVQALLTLLVKEGKINKHTDKRPYRYSVGKGCGDADQSNQS